MYFFFYNLIASEDVFEGLIRETSNLLEKLASKGSARNLPWNYVAWATFSHQVKSPTSGTYRMSLLGDVNIIYDATYIYASMASQYGYCLPENTLSFFDKSSYSFKMTIKDYFNATTGEPACPLTIREEIFGVAPRIANMHDLNLQFDARSINVALSINMGIIDISSLEMSKIPNSETEYIVNYCKNNPNLACNGLNISNFQSYFSSRYLGMSRIYCITWTDPGPDLGSSCFIRVGNAVLYPTVHHWEKCDCNSIKSDKDKVAACNEVDILLGLLYNPNEAFNNFTKTLEVVSYFIKMKRSDPIDGDNLMNKYTYNASRVTIDGVYSEYRKTKQEVFVAFKSICPLNSCSLIVLESWDENFNIINDYNLQVRFLTMIKKML